MHETKDKIRDIECAKEKLASWLMDELDCGKEFADAEESGLVTDMIKDLAEAEKYCWEACYYKSIVNAMEEAGEDEERRGYDNYRYANGRFAPTGQGTRRGYIMPEYPTMNNRMGYVENLNANTPENGRSNYGMNYDHYNDARRHYTMTHAQRDKDDMDMHANQHLAEVVASVKEIWKHAEPDMRTKMKTDLTNLINELK